MVVSPTRPAVVYRMTGDGRYAPIGDYAIVGDCRSAALVSRDGSIDWLCWPRFDSASVFAAILDARIGGRFRVRPVGAFTSTRRYLPETNVLETTFRTGTGVCTLRDLMPVLSEPAKLTRLVPEHEILREVAGVEGEVELAVLFEPRPDYARATPRVQDRGRWGFWCRAGRGELALRAEADLRPDADRRTVRGRVRVRAGERRYLSLAYSDDAPMVAPLLGEAAATRIEETAAWWRDWAGHCRYTGPYRDSVVRSALTLKLLAFAPSGAVVAAPTTSLPEHPGGERNWDYRYCWLRDASFTVRALLALGYDAEATAFAAWLLHATRLTWPELQIVYDVYGEARLPERTLDHLEGYGGARPVRVGNDACGQLQLDVYGEVLDAVARVAAHDNVFDMDEVRFLEGLGRTVCRRWREPDEGIWEERSGRRHHTYSKALCWVALDRLIKLNEAGHIAVDSSEFRRHRDALRAEIEARGFNAELGSYTRTYDSADVDASLFVLGLYGYVAGDDPRMRSTCERIYERLGRGPLIYRYEWHTDDGLPPGEGTFGICAFWGVECRAMAGDLAGATRDFEALLGHANDVGLFAEEIDPDTGAALGNFPQAFTHVGLINAAMTLAERAGAHRPRPGAAQPATVGISD